MNLRPMIAAFVLIVAGCSTVPTVEPVPPPLPDRDFVEIRWAPEFAWGNEAWRAEIEPLFQRVVVVHAHGSTLAGQWVLWDDTMMPRLAHAVVNELQADYPGYMIVLLSCNEDGHILYDTGVAYAQDLVWIVPDAAVEPWQNVQRDYYYGEDVVGSFAEFVIVR